MVVSLCSIHHFLFSTVCLIRPILQVLLNFTSLICSFHRGLEMSVKYQYNLSPQRLRVWYCSQVVGAALSVSALEAVLMMRGKQSFTKLKTALWWLASHWQSMPSICKNVRSRLSLDHCLQWNSSSPLWDWAPRYRRKSLSHCTSLDISQDLSYTSGA